MVDYLSSYARRLRNEAARAKGYPTGFNGKGYSRLVGVEYLEANPQPEPAGSMPPDYLLFGRGAVVEGVDGYLHYGRLVSLECLANDS